MHRPLIAAAILFSLALTAEAESPATLFNGKDLTGWVQEPNDPAAATQGVWTVADGVLRCQGRPTGCLRTKQDYGNYRLQLEWRWPGKAGNSGVLIHTSTPRVLYGWPKSLEVQLRGGNAGDFWVIGTQIDAPNEPDDPKVRRHFKLIDGAEKPVGEWNKMEVLCDGASVVVWVNGRLTNLGGNLTVTRGAICLQSEGTPVEFRNVHLTPLGLHATKGSGSKQD